MKRKKIFTVMIACAVILSVAGCSLSGSAGRKKRSRDREEEYEKDFGTYTIDDPDWVEVSAHSDPPDHFSYCVEGNENDRNPNNIAVNHGESNYDEDEHEEFREAIMRDLGRQIQDAGIDAEITGSGITTDNDLTAYRFEIESDDNLTVMWYIVGDREYVQVSAAIWDEDEAEDDGILDVAEGIVDSFEWD